MQKKDDRPVCFVVMGFGRKTDFESGRTLDLDATYEAIIQPAATEAGYRCIRANEILHSGVIDVKMYEMLLRSELVIADISTGNVNAVYELGVRHALRPFSTIIMTEDKGKLHFDLDHTNTFKYEHLGTDIGNREAKRATTELRALISAVREEGDRRQPDSPVYTYIPYLNRPQLGDREYENLLEQTEEINQKFSDLVDAGEAAARASNHLQAKDFFTKAHAMNPGDSYLVQQIALHTYKSKSPSTLAALTDALSIINALNPEESNDPETLGICGAINKNLWLNTSDLTYLSRAIFLYEKGFLIRRDYYNGENAAACYLMRSPHQATAHESMYDMMSAKKIQANVLATLEKIVASEDFSQRSDRLWIFASLAHTSYALGNNDNGERYEAEFYALDPAEWQIATFQSGKDTMLSLLENDADQNFQPPM